MAQNQIEWSEFVQAALFQAGPLRAFIKQNFNKAKL
jgi:hypothetical protein